jgi:hypothetical protein
MGKVLLVMGHRNIGGGNPEEAARTPLIVDAASRELRRAGHTVHILQREDNSDQDPNFTHRDLAYVANRCTALIQQHGIQVMIDAHFQGSGTPTSGCFGIFPDGNNLKPRPNVDDSKAANRHSVDFARKLAEEVSNQTNIRLLPLSEPGFRGGMSETQSGEGWKGNRLGMFWRTLPVRAQCVRVIMEHGDIIADSRIINSPGFYDRVANAYVRAVNAFWPVTPPNPQFFAFAEPRAFTAHAGAIGRRFASTDSDIIRQYSAGESIRCVGYYESQTVAGDNRWLKAMGEEPPRIHRSGVVEEIPQGTQEPSPVGGIASSPTEEELARSEALLRGDAVGDVVADPTTIGCEMTLTAEEPAAPLG